MHIDPRVFLSRLADVPVEGASGPVLERQGLNCCSPELMDDDFAAFGEIVEIVRPLLHHATPLGEVLGVVVGGANLVAFVMGKLAFDPIGMKPHFV